MATFAGRNHQDVEDSLSTNVLEIAQHQVIFPPIPPSRLHSNPFVPLSLGGTPVDEPAEPPSSSSKWWKSSKIALIVIGSVVGLIVIVLVVLFIARRRHASGGGYEALAE